MLKEIHLAGSVRTPFGSFCGAFAEVSTVELGKAAVERSGVKPEDVKESVGRSGSQIAPPEAPRTNPTNYYEHLPIFVRSDQLFLVCRTSWHFASTNRTNFRKILL